MRYTAKIINLFRVDENRIAQYCAACPHCSMLSAILDNIVAPESGVTMLNNIVNNIEQCGQQNIVQSCFHQPKYGCALDLVSVHLQYSVGLVVYGLIYIS